MAGNDKFVILPTGNGKSLICAVLPIVFDAVEAHATLNLPKYKPNLKAHVVINIGNDDVFN